MNAASATTSTVAKSSSLAAPPLALDRWVQKADALALSVGASMKQAEIQTDLSPSFDRIIGQTNALVDEIKAQVASGKPLDMSAIAARRQAVVQAADEAMTTVPTDSSDNDTPVGGSANQAVVAVTQTDNGAQVSTLSPDKVQSAGGSSASLVSSATTATSPSQSVEPTTIDLAPNTTIGLTPTVDLDPEATAETVSQTVEPTVAAAQTTAVAAVVDTTGDLVSTLRASRAAFHTVGLPTQESAQTVTSADSTDAASPAANAGTRPGRGRRAQTAFTHMSKLLSRLLLMLSQWLDHRSTSTATATADSDTSKAAAVKAG